MKHNIEKPSYKELTALHEEAAKLCNTIDRMKEERSKFVEYLFTSEVRDLPEKVHDLLMRSVDHKDAAINRRVEEYESIKRVLTL